MTRLKYYLPIGLLMLAVALSLTAGFGLPAIGAFCSRIVGEHFAVSHQVAPRGESAPAFLSEEAIPVFVADGTVTIAGPEGSAPAVLELDQVILTASDPSALRANRLRSGLMTLLLLGLALLCSAALSAAAVALLGANRRAAQKRRTRPALCGAGAPPHPLPPSGPRRLTRAA